MREMRTLYWTVAAGAFALVVTVVMPSAQQASYPWRVANVVRIFRSAHARQACRPARHQVLQRTLKPLAMSH